MRIIVDILFSALALAQALVLPEESKTKDILASKFENKVHNPANRKGHRYGYGNGYSNSYGNGYGNGYGTGYGYGNGYGNSHGNGYDNLYGYGCGYGCGCGYGYGYGYGYGKREAEASAASASEDKDRGSSSDVGGARSLKARYGKGGKGRGHICYGCGYGYGCAYRVEPKPQCNCGESHQAKRIVGRIVGGDPTEVNEYPWQVLLIYPNDKERLHCGGSIISNRHILTAAHCTVDPSLELLPTSALRVILGEHVRSDSVADIWTISDITNHPDFDGTNNDISIITLIAPMTFSPIVSPICLPAEGTSETFAGKKATVTGWGFTTSDGENPSDTLKKVDITVKTNADCSKSLGRLVEIRNTNICAGDPMKSACGGDSGGPLFLAEGLRGRITQIGVVNFNKTPICGEPGSPTVYARVSEYKDWIKSVAYGTQDSNCVIS